MAKQMSWVDARISTYLKEGDSICKTKVDHG